jgi:hypothetical protein
MALTNAEKQKAQRLRNKQKGLREVSYWVDKTEHDALRKNPKVFKALIHLSRSWSKFISLNTEKIRHDCSHLSSSVRESIADAYFDACLEELMNTMPIDVLQWSERSFPDLKEKLDKELDNAN